MRRSARLFEIIQILRSANGPVTADWIAETLEVSVRTIYRDIAALQAMRTPIEGEAGIGYIMRSGYDLPPLNFGPEEIEALIVGLSLLARTGDEGLRKAARRISSKIQELQTGNEGLYVSDWGAPPPLEVDMDEMRTAIRDGCMIEIEYFDLKDQTTVRKVKPLALVYFVEATLLAAWCELRQDFRHFRIDRIQRSTLLEEYFTDDAKFLRQLWEAREMNEQIESRLTTKFRPALSTSHEQP